MNERRYNLQDTRLNQITIRSAGGTLIVDRHIADYIIWDPNTLIVTGFKEDEKVLMLTHVDEISVELYQIDD